MNILRKTLTVAAALLLALPGCENSPQPEVTETASKPKFAVLVNDITSPYWSAVIEGVNDAKTNLKLDLVAQGTPAAGQAEEQLNMCEAMELARPDAFIVAAVNYVNLLPCLRRASERGALIVDLDGNLDFEIAAESNVDLSLRVASDNYEIGRMAADYLSKTQGKVLVIEGIPGSIPSEKRVAGFVDNNKSLDVVASLSAHWDRQKAADIANDILNVHPDLKVIYAANDGMALGALQSVKALGRNDIVIVGVDGTPNAIAAINAGDMKASVAQLPYLMGKVAVETANSKLQGSAAPKITHVPILVLDKPTLADKSNELLQYLR